MEQPRFKIVFEKLAEATAQQGEPTRSLRKSEATRAEIDEIAALRKIVLEVTEPPPRSYTTT